MEDGHLSDAKGRKVDFRNAIILMTSNVGADVIGRSTSLGFARQRDTAQTEQEAYDDMSDKVLGELKRIFRPEFMNRIDGVIVFHALNREQIKDIVDLEVGKVRHRLVDHGLELHLTDAARSYLADEGYDPSLGARPLRRAIQLKVEDVLSEGVLAGRFNEGDRVTVDLADGELTFHRDEPQEGETQLENGEEPQALEPVLN
jgi:ATP-dependent Clp protease ATP-binding subunit ClpC